MRNNTKTTNSMGIPTLTIRDGKIFLDSYELRSIQTMKFEAKAEDLAHEVILKLLVTLE